MTPVAAPAGRPRSRAVATWLALLGGGLGLHRFYLHGARDLWAWIFTIPASAFVAGVFYSVSFTLFK